MLAVTLTGVAGYGLSYSNLTSSAPRVTSTNVSATDTITVEVDVTNHSPLSGSTVVQLYFQQEGGSAAVIRYYQQLVRFARVRVEASSTMTVKLPLKIADLSYYDNNEEGTLGQKGWRLGRAGKRAQYRLMAGLCAGECTQSGACDLPWTRISAGETESSVLA